MEIKKDWYKSKTVRAGITLLLVFLKQAFDLDIWETELEPILEMGTQLVASILAIIGRFQAKEKIS